MPSRVLKKIVWPVLLIIVVAAGAILKSGCFFLLLAMLPSVMAFYMDSDRKKSRFKTVVTCNLAATLPYLIPMAQAHLHMRPYSITALMSNPTTWLLVYGGAAAGWSLIFLFRLISRLFIVLSYEYKIAALEKTQSKLLDEWGSELRQ
jgi:hypothetical protein